MVGKQQIRGTYRLIRMGLGEAKKRGEERRGEERKKAKDGVGVGLRA